MALPFFVPKRETPASLRLKAETLLARADDFPSQAAGRLSTGENRLKRKGREGDFRQFRDYNESDRPQDIDWKRSARSDDVLIRERETNRRRIFDIRVQNDTGMDFHSAPGYPTKFEAAGILGVSFALRAKQKHDVTLYNGQKIQIDSLPSRILEKKIAPAQDFHLQAITILLGDFIAPLTELELLFAGLTSTQVILLQVLDPAEIELPYAGRTIFEDGKSDQTVNNVDAMRAQYQQALTRHLDALKQYALRRHWHYDLVRTDEDLLSPLNRSLSAIEDMS